MAPPVVYSELTTSVVIPMVEKAGFDLVWCGIFIVLLSKPK